MTSLYCGLLSRRVCTVYRWSHLSKHPVAFPTFIRLVLIFMRRMVAGISSRGANEHRVFSCLYVCVRGHVADAGGQECNQITADPSSLPSSTTGGTPPINANMLRYVFACGSAQAVGTSKMCVKVWMNNSQGRSNR